MRCEFRKYVTPVGPLEVCVNDCVYEPAEDTMAMIAAMNVLAEGGLVRPTTVVDVGSGTGILALAAAKLFNPSIVAAIDASPYAVEASAATLSALRGRAMTIQCDGLRCFRDSWDLALLNPPYLPSSRGELNVCSGWLEASWSENAGLGKMCEEVAKRSRAILILYSSLTTFDIDDCLNSYGFTRVSRLLNVRLFMESLMVELWARRPM